MAKVFANDHNSTVAANYFALIANLLNAWLYLHRSSFDRLLVSVDDSTTGEVIWTQFNNYTVLWKDANVVLTHLPADVRENFVAVCSLHTEHGIWQRFRDCALNFDGTILLRHPIPFPFGTQGKNAYGTRVESTCEGWK